LKPSDWKKIKFFGPKEFKHPEYLDLGLIKELDALRKFIGSFIIITSDWRSNDPGIHGKGLAIDLVAPRYSGSIIDLYFQAERFNFQGIGVYNHWKYKGRLVGGLHLDKRESRVAARWIGTDDGYHPLTHKNLLNLFKDFCKQ